MMQLDAKRLPPKMTPKQTAIMQTLIRRNPDGTLLDVMQLIDLVAPNTTRGAMLCSLRHLAAHGLVREDKLVTRRKRSLRTYSATTAGYAIFRPTI
jgi:hypothetical protein